MSTNNITDKPKIIQYEGKEGLLKVYQNSLSAKKEIFIYEISYASLHMFLEKSKAEEIRKEYLKKGLKIKEITNQPFHETYSEVKGFHERVMEIRYIDPSRLKIDTELFIYNNVVVYYNLEFPLWAVEIYDSNLANIQKKLFEYIWNQGERPVMGKDGRSSMF